MNIYLVGSLREGRVRDVAHTLREAGHEVFDDWHACHPDADDHWRSYEIERGNTYQEALQGPFARNVFQFDLGHLHMAEAVVLVAKPGKIGGFSAACELTWASQNDKHTFILLDGEPERWDVMALLAVRPWNILSTTDELVKALSKLAP